MRYLSFALLLLSFTASAKSTDTTHKYEPKNEMGFFSHGHIGSSGYNSDVNILGINYNRWVTPSLGYRVIGGYGAYNTESGIIQKAYALDTFYDKKVRSYINMGVLGFAVQAQRKFYKRIHFFAALELRGGYGTGQRDTVTVKTYKGQEYYASSPTTSGQAAISMFYLGFSPTVGAKIIWPRLTAGLELYPANMTMNVISRTGSMDFQLGNLGQRFFLNYRFH